MTKYKVTIEVEVNRTLTKEEATDMGEAIAENFGMFAGTLHPDDDLFDLFTNKGGELISVVKYTNHNRVKCK